MPGLLASFVMKNLQKNKVSYPHYVPRDYAAEREKARKLSALQPLPRRIRREAAPCGFWYGLADSSRKKVVMYIHGGGFNTGSAEHSYYMAIRMCDTKDRSVFSVEYRLAPEHPYPDGLLDCVAAYQQLLETGLRGKDIVFAGDSAGGNLVFATALYLRDHGIELPAGLLGISPVGTLDDSLPSRKERIRRDAIISADFTEEESATYVLGHDVRDPYLSPVYGDFSGLPPVWLCAGTEEIFYDDAFALRDAAERAGIPAELLVGEGLCHVYPVIPDRQSTKAVRSMNAFIEKCLMEGNE